MTIQECLNWLRDKLLGFLEIPVVIGLLDAKIEMVGKLERSDDEQIRLLKGRIDELEAAYAQDPRRAAIAKEKAEKLNVVPGFQPRSARRSRWETERKAEPKK